MSQHLSGTAPPQRPGGMRAFFDRITLGQLDEEDEGSSASQLAPRAAYNPANDMRDLDQRVREIGEW